MKKRIICLLLAVGTIVTTLVSCSSGQNSAEWEGKPAEYCFEASLKVNKNIVKKDEVINLRPHAQHGLIVRKKVTTPCTPESYDMASSVVGIIQIRIDRVKEWIGTGALLTQDNLFPAPAYDYGYDLLLQRGDLFEEEEFQIAKFV